MPVAQDPVPWGEGLGLAPYAVSATRGRRRAEPDHAFRSPFQRDRDRVIHSRAFRRLEGKTQVFLSGSGDHLRTRLTHTMEVTAIARTIARRLRVNEDLTEAISLAHDLGHTPFGHVGERVLNELLTASGLGFDHNLQSLRVVDDLERKYPHTDGLNLTWEVRSGLIKRRSGAPASLDGVPLPTQPTIEAQIADLADDLAYYTHDLDDGLDAGLISLQDLAGVHLWGMACEQATANGASPAAECFAPYTIRCLIDTLVGMVIQHSLARLEQERPADSDQVGALSAAVVGFPAGYRQHSLDLRDFLFRRVYWHPDVLRVNREVGDVVRRLFVHFSRSPEQMGQGAQARMAHDGLPRAVADYIAGMTDRYALALHERFCR